MCHRPLQDRPKRRGPVERRGRSTPERHRSSSVTLTSLSDSSPSGIESTSSCGPSTPEPNRHHAPRARSCRRYRSRVIAASERDSDSALPSDVVLRLVETVAIELVDEVATFGAHADAAEAVFDAGAEVTGELRPRTV